MVCRKAGIDRREFPSLRIVNGCLFIRRWYREIISKWIIRSFLAEGGIRSRTNGRGNPYPPVTIHHGIVRTLYPCSKRHLCTIVWRWHRNFLWPSSPHRRLILNGGNVDRAGRVL